MKIEIYRYLEEGEVIQAGDEYQTLAGTWVETHCDTQALSYSKLYQGKYRRKVKEEKQMKYEILKPVSVESVGAICQQAGEKLAFWILGNGYSVGFGTILVEATIKAMPDHFRAWLVDHGFIRLVKEFEPFDIRVETAEELDALFMHMPPSCSKLWDQIKEKLEADR